MITKVVGVTFSNEDGSSRTRIIAGMSETDKICLERDPYNQFDSNAVKVCVLKNGEKKQIGFLAKDIASSVSPKLRKGVKFNTKIIGCGMWNDRPFCEIEIEEQSSSETATASSTVRPVAPKPVQPVAPKPINPIASKVQPAAPKIPKVEVHQSVDRTPTYTQSRQTYSSTSNRNTNNTSNNSGCMSVIVFAVIISGIIAFL